MGFVGIFLVRMGTHFGYKFTSSILLFAWSKQTNLYVFILIPEQVLHSFLMLELLILRNLIMQSL